MKELTQHIKPGNEIQVQRAIEKKKIFIGDMVPKRGMKCYEFNYKTGEIKPATFNSVEIIVTGGAFNRISKKIITKEDCLYCVAINESNALKKFFKVFQAPKS